ncbi:MAG TPA: hypothetical protein VK324_03130 [Tepidisphaeraceae bacterium]|nr:hypothetical protein [Tepidisphaeraceae bacterium]
MPLSTAWAPPSPSSLTRTGTSDGVQYLDRNVAVSIPRPENVAFAPASVARAASNSAALAASRRSRSSTYRASTGAVRFQLVSAAAFCFRRVSH